MQLVPFGEYVPLKRLLFFVGPLVEAVSDFSRGHRAGRLRRRRPPGQRGHLLRVGVPGDRARLRRSAAASCSRRSRTTRGSGDRRRPTSTSSRARSARVEQGRYVVRAANTGISGAVDPYGRVLDADGSFVPAAVTVDVRLLSPHDLQPSWATSSCGCRSWPPRWSWLAGLAPAGEIVRWRTVRNDHDARRARPHARDLSARAADLRRGL